MHASVANALHLCIFFFASKPLCYQRSSLLTELSHQITIIPDHPTSEQTCTKNAPSNRPEHSKATTATVDATPAAASTEDAAASFFSSGFASTAHASTMLLAAVQTPIAAPRTGTALLQPLAITGKPLEANVFAAAWHPASKSLAPPPTTHPVSSSLRYPFRGFFGINLASIPVC